MDYCVYCMAEMDPNTDRCPNCGQQKAYACPEYHLKPGTILQDRFMIGASIGEGGFGITYLARDMRLEMAVAIKEFYPKGFANRSHMVHNEVSTGIHEKDRNFFAKAKQRFLDEAKTLAKLSDVPGIVQVRDFFEENNTAYIVMEYLRGQTLKTYLSEQEAIDYKETYLLLQPVIRSLAIVHEHNLIHRDISPDNIMLTKNGAKLMDFGAARTVFIDSTNSLTVVMKPGYAPEEQYTRRGLQGPWTDVYALCATMYRCITGEVPMDAISRRTEDLDAPSALGWPIDKDFEKILMKGLSILPADRYSNMGELSKAFEDWLKHSQTEDDDTTAVKAEEALAAASAKQPEPIERGSFVNTIPSVEPQEMTEMSEGHKKVGDDRTVLMLCDETSAVEMSVAHDRVSDVLQVSTDKALDEQQETSQQTKTEDGVVYCSHCGQRVLVSERKDGTCPKCAENLFLFPNEVSEKNGTDTAFCPFCGEQFLIKEIENNQCPHCGETVISDPETSNNKSVLSNFPLWGISLIVIIGSAIFAVVVGVFTMEITSSVLALIVAMALITIAVAVFANKYGWDDDTNMF